MNEYIFMTKFFFLISCLCLSSNLLSQQGIQTKNVLTAQELVSNVFIKGNCRNVSNITSIGNEILSIGQFENGASSINVNSGIILSTGDMALSHGPNISPETSFSFNVISDDPDLTKLATDSLFDVTGIEFDFIPLDDEVTFRYVFASEEYCEYVGSPFNDVFGFFVSGPGINGTFTNNAINVAKLIGTNEDVSINTVNHIDNVDFYINNVTNLDAESCMIDYTPDAEDEIEYDGFTVPLIASFEVIPCETYHIRLLVGDVGDDQLDSGVFLETNSFDIGEGINVRAEVPGSDEPIAYESCVDGQFVFTRSTFSDINEDLTIEYNISSDSRAINGVDFEEIPLSITIPAGQFSQILPISLIEDNVMEGPENLKLELIYDCDCIDPTISELMIQEVEDFSVNSEEINVCAGQNFSITPEIVGGVPPFDFLWDNGVDTAILELSISEPRQFKVTVTDNCGRTVEHEAAIEIQSVPTATLMGSYNHCETSVSGIPVEMEGYPPWSIGYRIDGIDQVLVENIQFNPFYIPTPTVGTYELTTFKDAYCNGQFSGIAIVGSDIEIDAEIIHPTCYNSNDGSIELTQINAAAPYTITWSVQSDDQYFLEQLQEGEYVLNIEDVDGCTFEKTFNLSPTSNEIEDCLTFYIPNIFSPNNDGNNDIFSIFFDSSSEITNIISLEVYNRWGEILFEQTNIDPESDDLGWNGDYKGEPLNPGIYIYRIVLAFENDSTLQFSGDIMLLR